MTSQRDIDQRKELVHQLCTQSNRVFRVELCVKRHLEQKGFSPAQIKEALDKTRLGELEQLADMLASAGVGPLNRFKPNQTVRINDTQSEYHKCLARVVKVAEKSYDVAVGLTTMRVVPEQLLGVRKP